MCCRPFLRFPPDVAFAITSFFVAARLVSANAQARRGFVAWHLLGLLGLLISVTLAVLTSSDRFGLVKAGMTSQAMTRFPMSLVPVFIGPMVLIFHLLALAAVYENRKSRRLPAR
jgi:nitrate/nitrite transporter NarK